MRVIICPHCDMKYRIDPAKFQQDELRIKCKSCSGSFGVDLADPDSAPYPIGQKQPSDSEVAQKTNPPSQPAAPPTSSAAPSNPVDAGNNLADILVAHDKEDVLKEIETLLSDANFSVTTVTNGVDALMYIEQHKPKIAILDVSLPKMFGFEVCEVVRRDNDLANVKLILIAAIYDKSRYKRNPTTLYGADDYIEKHAIEATLVEKCKELFAGTGTQLADSNAAAEAEPPTPTTEPTQTAATSNASEEQLERARRLARTIISDIALYNQEKLEDGVRNDNAHEALAAELNEGQQLFDTRIDDNVKDAEQFLRDALDAVVTAKKQEYGIA